MRIAALVALLVAAFAQPDVRPAISVVRVDVIATDAHGRAVEGLRAADFELREDGAAQIIEAVRLVKPNTTAPAETQADIRSEHDEQQQASSDGARLFGIFLDEYHVSDGPAAQRVRDSLTRFVEHDLGPRDLAVVMKPLDSVLTIRMTRDRGVLRRVIESFEGRKGDYRPRTDFETNFMGRSPDVVEQSRTQVTISALNALAGHLGSVADARKAVVLVSEGFTGPPRQRGRDRLPDVQSLVRTANRSNVAIYVVDPREPSTAPEPDPDADQLGRDLLQSLADDTDGRMFADAANLDAGLQQLLADSSAYYLLTYHAVHPDDGKFHQLQVSVKRPGVTLRARKGYWTPFPDEVRLASAPPEPKGASAPALPLYHVSPLIRPWFGVSRGPEGRTRVTFVWEPAPAVPGERARRVPFRIVLQAFTENGESVFEGPVTPSGAGREDGARAVFDVPPGRLRVAMWVQDNATQVLDSDSRDVSIRDLSAPVAIGTPEVFRARNAFEVRALDGDPDAAPCATREFGRTDRLIVRVPAYGPPDVAVRVTAKLLNRLGQPMRDVPVQDPAGTGETYRLEMSLAGLSTSDYFIELTATSPSTAVKERVGFRIIG